MLFVIECLDKPGAAQIRADNITEHRAYQKSKEAMIVLAGPLMDRDGKTSIGSLFVVEAPSVTEAEAFNDNDPFRKAGLWDDRRVFAFEARVKDGDAMV